jgi:hypothetical protein
VVLLAAAAGAGVRIPSPTPPSGATDPSASASLPWWKRALSHTVQEEWVFAQAMDAQYGPRWRTALPDKVVAHLYQSWQQRPGSVVPP